MTKLDKVIWAIVYIPAFIILFFAWLYVAISSLLVVLPYTVIIKKKKVTVKMFIGEIRGVWEHFYES